MRVTALTCLGSRVHSRSAVVTRKNVTGILVPCLREFGRHRRVLILRICARDVLPANRSTCIRRRLGVNIARRDALGADFDISKGEKIRMLRDSANEIAQELARMRAYREGRDRRESHIVTA